MPFVKKYPLLVTVLTLLVLAFVAQAVFVFLKMGEAAKAQNAYRQQKQQLERLLQPGGDTLALTKDNVEKIDAATKQARLQLQQMLAGLGGEKVYQFEPVPANGTAMLFRLQRFVDELNGEAKKEAEIINPTSGVNEIKPQVQVPADFAYGFSRYLAQGVQPPADGIVRELSHQREIIEYLTRTLFSSRPKNQFLELVSVERELAKGEPPQVTGRSGATATGVAVGRGAATRRQQSDLFEINTMSSARVPGAIDTLAFRLKFVGYTDVMRNFLNTLAKFELPLVVRSVEVKPQSNARGTAARRTASRSPNFEALFGGGSTASSSDAPQGEGASAFVPKEPIVSDNLSEYTVLIEYISLTDAAKDEAKPAAPAPAAQP